MPRGSGVIVVVWEQEGALVRPEILMEGKANGMTTVKISESTKIQKEYDNYFL